MDFCVGGVAFGVISIRPIFADLSFIRFPNSGRFLENSRWITTKMAPICLRTNIARWGAGK